jgi:hypothetical protein
MLEHRQAIVDTAVAFLGCGELSLSQMSIVSEVLFGAPKLPMHTLSRSPHSARLRGWSLQGDPVREVQAVN